MKCLHYTTRPTLRRIHVQRTLDQFTKSIAYQTTNRHCQPSCRQDIPGRNPRYTRFPFVHRRRHHAEVNVSLNHRYNDQRSKRRYTVDSRLWYVGSTYRPIYVDAQRDGYMMRRLWMSSKTALLVSQLAHRSRVHGLIVKHTVHTCSAAHGLYRPSRPTICRLHCSTQEGISHLVGLLFHSVCSDTSTPQ